MSDDDQAEHITGYFVRCRRDERWRNLDIADLSDAELDEFLVRQGKDMHGKWAKALAQWIRDAYRQGAFKVGPS